MEHFALGLFIILMNGSDSHAVKDVIEPHICPLTSPEPITANPSPRQAPTPPGRTFLNVEWIAEGESTVHTEPIVFKHTGSSVTLKVREELVGQPYGLPYKVAVSNTNVIASSTTDDSHFLVTGVKVGRSQLMVTDSLNNEQTLDVTVC